MTNMQKTTTTKTRQQSQCQVAKLMRMAYADDKDNDNDSNETFNLACITNTRRSIYNLVVIQHVHAYI